MSKYVDIAIAKLRGRRLWTVTLSELVEDDVVQGDVEVIDISEDLRLAWGFVKAHGLFVGALASSGSMVVRDNRSVVYDRLLAAKTTLERDDVFLVTITSNDGTYTWQGHIRQDEVRRPEFTRVRQNVVRLALYDGVGDADNFSFDGFAAGGSFAMGRILHSALRILWPLQWAVVWNATNRNAFIDLPLSLTIEESFYTRPGVHKLSTILDKYAAMLLMRVFQGMDGYWHLRQAWTLASSVEAFAGGALQLPDTTPVFSPPDWQTGVLVPTDIEPTISRLRVDLDEAGADMERILEPPINEVVVSRSKQMNNEAPDYALNLLKDGSFEEAVGSGDPGPYGSGSGSGTRQTFDFWDNVGGAFDSRNAPNETGSSCLLLQPGEWVRQGTLYVGPDTEHFFAIVFSYVILDAGGSASAEFRVSLVPLFPTLDDTYYLTVDGTWSTADTILSTAAQTAQPFATASPTWYTQTLNSVEPVPITGKLFIEFFGGTGSGDTHHTLFDRAGLIVTDNEGVPSQRFDHEVRFRNINAAGAIEAGESLEIEIPADLTLWPLHNPFLAPYDPYGISMDPTDLVALWVPDQGGFESDLAKVIADKIFRLQGSRRWGLEGTISRLVPPEAVLFYDDTYWVCDYLRMNLFDETTQGHWIELAEMPIESSEEEDEAGGFPGDADAFSSHSHYFEITTDETLTTNANSVLRYNLAQAPAGFWSTVRSDGGDLRMAGADGTYENRVPFEVIDFDQGAETGWIFFRSYALAGGDQVLDPDNPTTYRIYYGSIIEIFPPAVDQDIGRNAVYDDAAEAYEAVLHLEEDPTGSAPQYIDATGNGHDGTTSGAAAGDTLAGQIGMGFDPDGVGEYSAHGQLMPDSETPFTWCVWRHPDSGSGAGRGIVSQDNHPYGLTIRTAATGASVDIRRDNTVILGPVTTSGFSMSRVVLTYDPVDKWKLYVDGAEVDTDAVTGYPSFSSMGTKSFRVSGRVNAGTTFIGIIDEVYVLLAEMSAEWVETEYNMDSDNATFWATGAHTANN